MKDEAGNEVQPQLSRFSQHPDFRGRSAGNAKAAAEASLGRLGLETIDVYYVHNPESQLSDVDPPAFRSRLRAAFEMLEGAVAQGKLCFYGVASWNAFRLPPGQREVKTWPGQAASSMP